MWFVVVYPSPHVFGDQGIQADLPTGNDHKAQDALQHFSPGQLEEPSLRYLSSTVLRTTHKCYVLQVDNMKTKIRQGTWK